MQTHLTDIRSGLQDALRELLAHAQRHPTDPNLVEIVSAADHVAIALGTLCTLDESAGQDESRLTWRLGSLMRDCLPDGIDEERLLTLLEHRTPSDLVGDVAAELTGTQAEPGHSAPAPSGGGEQ